MFEERFVALVHNLACCRVGHSFVLPLPSAIYEPVKFHPPPGLTI
jgi:hypothetical protein